MRWIGDFVSSRGRRPLIALALVTGIGALTPSAALAIPACQPVSSTVNGATSWTNASGGSWDDPNNWSNGVPSASCSTSITLAGTYTVVMPDGALSAGLTLGGSSGTQTLQLVGTTQGNGSPQDSNLSPSYSGQPFTIGAHGVLQLTSSGSNPGRANLGGTVVNSGLITVDAGAPGPNTSRVMGVNMTNNAGGVIAFHTDVNTCGCGIGGTWVNNGTLTTNAGTTSFFSRTGAGVSFTQGGGTFTNNGRAIVDGAITHSGGTTTGNPIQVCGNVDAHDPSAASFEIIYDTNYCGGGAITADIGASDTVLVNNTDPAAHQLLVGATNGITNFGTLTLEGGPGDKYLIAGQGHSITNAGTLNFQGSGRSELQTNLVNTGTVTVAPGETVTADGAIAQTSGVLTNSGTVDSVSQPVMLSGGTLQGSGTIVAPAGVHNTGGTVHPGNSPGVMSITGDYTQGAAGALAVDVAGTAPGTGYSQLAVSGKASIAGTLRVTTAPPQKGIFRILTAATLTGTFAPIAFAGQTDIVAYDATGVSLHSAAPAPPPVVSHAHLGSGSFTAATGTTLVLNLSEPATITLVILHRTSGRVAHGRCSSRAKRGHRCSLSVVVRTIKLNAIAGHNVLRLRLLGLATGHYTAVLVADDRAGHRSHTVTVSFVIKAPTHPHPHH